jgi:high-affinity Fe2+/Pb2+ permease
LEAVIVVVVLLQFLSRTLNNNPQQRSLLRKLRAHVWTGAIAGLVLALSVGICLMFVVWVLKRDILPGGGDDDDDENELGELFECLFELLAVGLQT